MATNNLLHEREQLTDHILFLQAETHVHAVFVLDDYFAKSKLS